MKTIDKLKKCVKDGLIYALDDKIANPDIEQVEVFAASNEQLTARLNFTSHIPCNALQEPKSNSSFGVGVRVVFKKNGKRLFGEGGEDNNVSVEGVKLALAKARKNVINDPSFKSLPVPAKEKPSLSGYHDPKVLELSNDDFVGLAYQVMDGSLEEFKKNGLEAKNNLIVGGDITILKEEIAIANSNGISDFDQSTVLMTNITAMIESENAKGTGWASGTNLKNFNAQEAGRMAVRSAISTIGGRRIKNGKYNVILGPQPVCTITSNLIISALSLDSACLKESPFSEKFGEIVMSPELSIYDDGALPGSMASKKITCEGLPTGRTQLIDRGRLIGLLADTYWVNHPDNKFSITGARSGFRFSGGGRHHRASPGIEATNLVIHGTDPVTSEELIQKIDNGIYIGRLWYLYPINLGAGDFTGTIVGDSYIIKDGKIEEPLQPNAVRLNDNWIRLMKDHVMGVSDKAVPTLVWAAEEVIIAPEIAIKDMSLEEIDKEISV